MAETQSDWADEDPPADRGRRRFLQATLAAGAAAVVVATVASAKSFIPPPFVFSGTIENTFRYGLPELDAFVIRRDVGGVPAAIVGLYDRCVHFCCKPGWHVYTVPNTLHNYVTDPRTFLATDPVSGASVPQDPIWCQCHNSQYDPVTLVHSIHPPPANVPYIGAQFVHGPASRALPCIPIKLAGSTIEGVYDPDDGGHPEWYSAYCR